MTDKDVIREPQWSSWKPVAERGELSAWSTTGVAFAKTWPIKPDVVFEGGNVVKNDREEVDFPCADLSLLTTFFKPSRKLLELSWATSAAAAQAARLAARIYAEYPDFWPETVRAVVVHAAEWTPRMQTHFDLARGKSDRTRLVQRYGFGVPSTKRALRSARDSLTLVAQNSIRPFAEEKMFELHMHRLPWPREVLADLGETMVRMRVTLSYFIEPNPGRRGWKRRYSYASHGLRFDVKGPTESVEEFRKRLNKKALEEAEGKPSTGGDSSEWFLGEQSRSRGSLHSDILECTAASLAERGVIAVYPVSGWWKYQPKRDRGIHGARYALVVTIETPDTDVDIWTPVAQLVGIPIAVDS